MENLSNLNFNNENKNIADHNIISDNSQNNIHFTNKLDENFENNSNNNILNNFVESKFKIFI